MKRYKMILAFIGVMNLLVICSRITHDRYLRQLVNPFIVTGVDGNTYPCVSMPYGGVQLSPDRRLNSCGSAFLGFYR